jgi:hypothetical protein
MVKRGKSAAHLILRWKGGAPTVIDLALPRKRQAARMKTRSRSCTGWPH